MGSGLWYKAVNLSAEAGKADFERRRRQLVCGSADFETRCPARPVEAAVAAVGSAVGTAAGPSGYSAAAFG